MTILDVFDARLELERLTQELRNIEQRFDRRGRMTIIGFWIISAVCGAVGIWCIGDWGILAGATPLVLFLVIVKHCLPLRVKARLEKYNVEGVFKSKNEYQDELIQRFNECVPRGSTGRQMFLQELRACGTREVARHFWSEMNGESELHPL